MQQSNLLKISGRRLKILIICILAGALLAAGFVFGILSIPSVNGGRDSSAVTEEPNLPPPPPTQREFELTHTTRTFYPLRDDDLRIVYLTFDDGPSYNVTPEILQILREHDVRATFFVLGSYVEQYPHLVLQAFEEGHTIANHSFSHKYREIYASPQALLDDIALAEAAINAALGFEYGNRLFRFPGGSHDKRDSLKNAVLGAGFQFVDWNAGGNDSVTSRAISADLVFRNTVQSAANANRAGQYQLTLLFHDNNTKMTTAEALPRIIEHFRSEGYEFRTLCEM